MATIPLPERNNAIDGVFRTAKEDVFEAARLIAYLYNAFPTFDWMGICRTRAPLWAPYQQTGLDTTWLCDTIALLYPES